MIGKCLRKQTVSIIVCILVVAAFLVDRSSIDIFHGKQLGFRLQNNYHYASIDKETLTGLSIDNGSSENLIGLLQSIRFCEQSERVAHLKKMCERRYDVVNGDLLKPAPRLLIDHKHHFTFCWMSKAGCTSFKAFILEANGFNVSKYPGKDNSMLVVHSLKTQNKYGLQQVQQINESKAKSIVDKYFNVMAIRHPFDRLVAYYRDKIVHSDPSSDHLKRAADILRQFRPRLFAKNKTLSKMKYPQKAIGAPTFREMMTWIYKNKVMDEHWKYIYESCHPCAHDWGAILRVETMQRDGRILTKLVNSTHDQVPVRHSHARNVTYSQFAKTLHQFADLPEEIVDYFLEFFRTDMMMFGYRWDKRTNTAYCAIETPNGLCC